MVPGDKEIHIICDNYATHKTPAVQAWLSKHKRVHVHFTPTSSSWLNMVERLFRDITENRIRRGVFRSVEELEGAIHDYLARHNARPKPFIWAASRWIPPSFNGQAQKLSSSPTSLPERRR